MWKIRTSISLPSLRVDGSPPRLSLVAAAPRPMLSDDDGPTFLVSLKRVHREGGTRDKILTLYVLKNKA